MIRLSMENDFSSPARDIRFHSLFENTPELILYQNEESTILDANPAFLKLVQEPKENVINRNYNEFLSEDVQLLYEEKLKEAFTGKTVRFDLYTPQGNSAPRHWDVVKIPVSENEKVVGVHMIARDITEKMQAQEEILEKNKDLQQFTYVVSHNLRSPLTNALGLVEVLEISDPGSSDFESTLTHLGTSLRQLDQVVRDINTILSIRDKQDLVQNESVPLAQVVHQAVQNFQEALHDSGGTARVAIPEGIQVLGNRAYLYSIFFNLLSNAIKFRSEQRPLQVDITLAVKDSQTKEISFADNGSGIDLDKAGVDMFKLYKRFHPQHSGRGLGLYLVKAHVESIGGQIEVSSRPNEGTIFKVSLQ
ncbi:PAS domain-containing sensor histidine kinase [Pontibacter harenae]|uniref:PAS domain-containing sensor histidine kinase n=1 Tax=Pontibacter harenae TaxID=2894083 RepID=UPI001E4E2116|nr:PAS domain-containing sensor histidine kinase [Pontibacter harenae]MCC9168401.1 PAS domain-containing sensor histidine kinase [Pontibacter harenae]